MSDEASQWTVEVFPDGRIEPCLVIESRYGGVYEGGRWLAFPRAGLPEGPYGGDLACAQWFAENGWWVGAGDDPEEAKADLMTKLDALAASGLARVHRWDREDLN